ncbi:MAG: C40 family peptidase [Acidobacteriia bacterium]|nr:C40 family peptidase [Terriglobia bacterium]
MKIRIALALCVSWFAPLLAAGQSPGPVLVAVIQSRYAQLDVPKITNAGKGPTLIHVVQEGDTLSLISRANNISVQALKRFNRLQSNRLRIGQRLWIASPENAANRKEGKSQGLPGGKRIREKPMEDAATDGELDADNSPEIALRSSEALVNDATSGSEKETDLSVPSQLVQAGLDFLGVPYRWRGMSEQRGVDCSGLVKTLFDRFQIELPHSAREQFKLGNRVARAELAVGDLVFFSTRGRIPTHVGIYIGDNRFIHAARKAGQVIISNLSQSWYQRNFVGARRISDLWRDTQKPLEAKGN